jgi:hypothetical protein
LLEHELGEHVVLQRRLLAMCNQRGTCGRAIAGARQCIAVVVLAASAVPMHRRQRVCRLRLRLPTESYPQQ